MEYNLVSADSHVDMSWLPGDLFVEAGPAHLKDKMPRVEETPDGRRWVTEGEVLGVAGGLGTGFMAPLKGRLRRMDLMMEAGFLDGMAEEKYHPTDPELRLRDMAKDGVDAEVLYGMTGIARRIKNAEVLAACFSVYNEWVSGFCASRPGRWYALACIPSRSPQLAAEELRRAARLPGIRGAELDVSGTERPIYLRDGFWDPLWEAAAECHMPISFHVGGGAFNTPLPEEGGWEESYQSGTPTQNQLAYLGVMLPLGQLSGAEWLASILMSGACDRYPDFQFVLGECGAGWIPFVIERLDMKFKEDYLEARFDPPLKLPPSEYWYRQGATTFQMDPTVGYMAQYIGEDNLMWGSDYPHPDGVWPDSTDVIAKTMGQLSKEVLYKITVGNAVRLYRMGE